MRGIRKFTLSHTQSRCVAIVYIIYGKFGEVSFLFIWHLLVSKPHSSLQLWKWLYSIQYHLQWYTECRNWSKCDCIHGDSVWGYALHDAIFTAAEASSGASLISVLSVVIGISRVVRHEPSWKWDKSLWHTERLVALQPSIILIFWSHSHLRKSVRK